MCVCAQLLSCVGIPVDLMTAGPRLLSLSVRIFRQVILEWVAISTPGYLSNPQDSTWASVFLYLQADFYYIEPPGKPIIVNFKIIT